MFESDLETAVLSWLDGLGYTTVTGDVVSLDGAQQARIKYSEVVLRPRLADAIARLNPGTPQAALDAAVTKLADYSNQSIVDGNREVYDWITGGVEVEVTGADGHRSIERLRVIDFDKPSNNDLLAVQQFTVYGQRPRRPDVILFVNGLPLVVIELKNPADEDADIEAAFNQIETYKADIPQLFYYNLLNVISDGVNARYGSLTADFSRYGFWRLLDGESQAESGLLELEVLIRGLMAPEILMHFLQGFGAFVIADGSPSIKVIAQWHLSVFTQFDGAVFGLFDGRCRA